jgi:1-aminocyclopropane-1-carboxylate deaminase
MKDIISEDIKAEIQKLDLEQFTGRGVQISLLREDKTDPQIGGNKLRKLKYNLIKAKQKGHDTLLTFGGVWSNHIYASAAAARRFGFKSIGIIRGEGPPGSTATLDFARSCGMKLHFVSRAEYREKNEDFFKAWLYDTFGRFHLIPEGGSNYLGLNGCMEILGKHTKDFDVIAVACGTGATLAGMSLKLGPHQKLMGFPVVGQGEHLKEAIIQQLIWALGDEEVAKEYERVFQLYPEYAMGGFAKVNDELISFMRQFYDQTKVKLDPLYTAKMMRGIYDLLEKGRFVPGTRILAVHTGGLQGIAGIERRLNEAIYPD